MVADGSVESDTVDRAAADAPDALSSVELNTVAEVDVLDLERREEEDVVLLPPVVGSDEAGEAVAEVVSVEERERDRREDDSSTVEAGKLPLFCSKWKTVQIDGEMWGQLDERGDCRE